MPLQKRWLPLERATIHRAPDRPGVYEVGADDGEILIVGHGIIRDELKDALAYGDADVVRWETTQTREQASELAEEHLDRLGE